MMCEICLGGQLRCYIQIYDDICVYIYIEGRHICIYATGENFAWRFHGDHSTNYPYRLSGAARCPCITWHKLIALLRRWVFWPKFSAETSFERHFFMWEGGILTHPIYIVYISQNPNDPLVLVGILALFPSIVEGHGGSISMVNYPPQNQQLRP